MALLEKHLVIKKSSLPGAGKGLFTLRDIPKGAWIVEYKGQILTWPQVEKMADYRNGYVFYVFKNHVIDAWNFRRSKGRYANDAMGIVRVPGLRNNSEYHVYKRRCYIKATRNIPAGSEILVGYGREYWQVIRHNIKDEAKKAKGKGSKRLPHHDQMKR